MSPFKHSAKEKDDIRARILATAWQMVKDEGWQSLSIRKIAGAVDYSIPVIYDHFENKEAIVFEFARQGFQMLTKAVQKAIEKQDDPVEKLKSVAEAYWKFAMAPINELIAKSSNPEANPYLKYFTFWSILHGLISIRNLNSNVSDEVNKMVMDDAVAGFIKNLG
jgi:AcrR family transcriptional regulator